MSREIRIGTMGFSYDDWVGSFYARGTKPGEFLSRYAERFRLVELDTTWHAMPDVRRVEKWAVAVPPDFRFTAKVPRIITHDRPLLDGLADMREFLRVMRHMGDKLAAILIQFPATFSVEHRPALTTFLQTLPRDLRFAVEFRNESWFRTGTIEILRERNIAWVAGEYESTPRPIVPTADFAYIRLIGRHGRFETHEREQVDVPERLEWWREQVEALDLGVQTVLLTINNDFAGHSPGTGARMAVLLNGFVGKLPRSEGSLFE